VLAAKAVVIGWVTFIAGLAGGTAALLLGERLLRSPGNFVLPVTALTEVRVVAGTAALFAVAAMLALAWARSCGTAPERSPPSSWRSCCRISSPPRCRCCPPVPRTGCCGSLRPPPSPSSRPSRGIRR
jgi:hypothetical protein